jgi:isopentenyl diphosphate isomerase/L-lactate dehydrogenase-like FMN-dependent dehydrogenase
VLTLDTPMAGKRERDPRNGMKELLAPALLPKARFLPNILAHPGWLASFLLDGGVPKLGNVVIPGKGPMDLIDVGAALSHAGASWEDLRWIRQIWPGPIVAKGLLTGDDGRRAVDEGVAAVVVSNHGGRQLDGVFAWALAQF